MSNTVKWFKPKHKSGFEKDKTVKANIRTMMMNADHRKNQQGRLLEVGKQALALSNVTKDKETKHKAKAVSEAAFKRRKK